MQDQEMKMITRKIYIQTVLVLVLVIAVLTALVNAVGLFLGDALYEQASVASTRFDQERFQSLQAELNLGRTTQHWRDVSVQSRFGYTLKGTFIPSTIPSKNTVIFVHGITNTRLAGLWYAPIYSALHYNVLIYDSRANGESGGDSISWGFYEQYDLDRWVDWVYEQQPDGIIGVHGVSMGAATALMHAEQNEKSKRVAFYIADSAYTDLEQVLSQQLGATLRFTNPLWVKAVLTYSSLAAYMKSGFLYSQISPLHAVRQVTTPVLYLHGEADTLTPVSMCQELYNATAGYREKYIFAKEGHATAVFHHKQEYREVVQQFIRNITNAQE